MVSGTVGEIGKKTKFKDMHGVKIFFLENMRNIKFFKREEVSF